MRPFKDSWTVQDVEDVISRADPEELLYVPIVVSMDPPNPIWSQDICFRLVDHDDWNVRGNAILGFGHLVRTTGQLDKDRVLPLVTKALSDPHEYVHCQAHAAADELSHYLDWSFPSIETHGQCGHPRAAKCFADTLEDSSPQGA
ncbi:MAG: hypothetical protein ACI9UU_000582 [Candidatus Azotimanducaceae bacterium]|jgi:hypothetical protein